MNKRILKGFVLLMSLLLFASCAKKGEQDSYDIDYLVLVNKLNPLPEDWEEKLQTVSFVNSIGDDVEVEKKAYDAYLKLKEDLEQEGVYVDLDSARRSIAAQQKIVDDFTAKYGADYTAKVVATPGYSEHHTGLALDLYLIVDGVDIIENEDLVQYPEIWDTIHQKLADYGFILRYLPNKEHITGYAYEPWHIRYVDDTAIAKEIMEKGITLEAYLGQVNETDPVLDYGESDLFSKDQIDETMIRVKCRFASMKGVELNRLAYAGDECSSQENLDWLNSLDGGHEYVKAIELLSDFVTGEEGFGTLEANREYTDYQWWLACAEDGSWDIVSFGY